MFHWGTIYQSLGVSVSAEEPPSITAIRQTILQLEKQKQKLLDEKAGPGVILDVNETVTVTKPEKDPKYSEVANSLAMRDETRDKSGNPGRKVTQEEANILGVEMKERDRETAQVLENVTDGNFHLYHAQGKGLMLNGQEWSIDEAKPDGSISLRRYITISEGLQLADKAKKRELEGGYISTPYINTPNVKIKAGMVQKADLISSAKWVIKKPPRPQYDPTRQEEVKEVKALQARLASGEFEDNRYGERELLEEVFYKYADRLKLEKEAYDRNTNI